MNQTRRHTVASLEWSIWAVDSKCILLFGGTSKSHSIWFIWTLMVPICHALIAVCWEDRWIFTFLWAKTNKQPPSLKKGRRVHGKESTTVAAVSHLPDIIMVDLGADRHPNLSGYAITLPHQWALVMRQREDFKRANSGLNIQKGGIWRASFMFKSFYPSSQKNFRGSVTKKRKRGFHRPPYNKPEHAWTICGCEAQTGFSEARITRVLESQEKRSSKMSTVNYTCSKFSRADVWGRDPWRSTY